MPYSHYSAFGHPPPPGGPTTGTLAVTEARDVVAFTNVAAFTGFRPLRIGGTGYITGIRISPDGNTRLIKTDTYGGYYWDSTYVNPYDGAVGRWSNTNIIGSYPSAYTPDPTLAWGCGEIDVAPSNSSICYSWFGSPDHFFKSTDGGKTWTFTGGGLSGSAGANAQQGRRFMGPQIAIHPTDPTKLYVYTQDTGLWYSSNSGASWTLTSVAVPAVISYAGGSFPMEGAVIIAPNGKVYATSSGNGLWTAASVGSTFTQVTGGPGTSYNFFGIACSSTSKVFLTGDGWGIGGSLHSLWRYDGTTWLDMSITDGNFNSTQCVFCDPNNANRMFVSGNGGCALYCYIDADATTPSNFTATAIPKTRQSHDTGEGPWPDPSISTEFLSEGSFQFDPLIANRLWFAEGIGVWYADIGTGKPANILWNFHSRGIEQLVATRIIATPNGALFGTGWDRAVFAWNASTPDAYAPKEIIDQNTSINHGWHIDWASADPTFLVAHVDCTNADPTLYGPAYSTDNGVTWTSFMSPSNTTPMINGINGYGGSLAAADTQKILWHTQWNNDLWYSANRGGSWTKQNLTAFGVPLNNGIVGTIGTNETGWGQPSLAGSGARHYPICADRATPGIFWAYNYGSQFVTSFAGIYKLDARSGTTWTRPFSGVFNGWVRDYYHAQLQSVPKLTSVDTTGHLFYTSGESGGTNPSAGTAFRFSVDGGGVTWNALANVAEVYAYGFGAAATGKDYPTIFFNGYVLTGGNWVWGLYKIEENFAAWQANSVTYHLIANYPGGWTDEIRAIDGDKLIKGRVYMGFGGSGFMYGNT